MNEFELVRKYFSTILADDPRVLCGTGDDAAIIQPDAGQCILVSTDTLIAGVHFPAETDSRSIGHKSLAVNLSDMAAMSAKPAWTTLSLTLPGKFLQHDWLQGFSDGFSGLARQHDVSLVGGDTCAGDLSITVQIIGTATARQITRRSGALPGHDVYVGGELGTAAWVLQKLGNDETVPDRELLHCLERPQPQLQLGQDLAGLASAMIDISDGLAADLGHILTASNTGAEIELERIPVNAALSESRQEEELWELLLSGGDDYKLCFTTACSGAELAEKLAEPVYRIGKINATGKLSFKTAAGTGYSPTSSGYRHF